MPCGAFRRSPVDGGIGAQIDARPKFADLEHRDLNTAHVLRAQLRQVALHSLSRAEKR